LVTKKRSSVLRETDDEARRLARVLMRAARYAAMAVLDPDSGFPTISRVLVGTDVDGVPVVLVSALSAHTKALRQYPRASLLTGEPGKGDPLAYPRLSVECLAQAVARDTPQHQRLRGRFLARHAKAKLYIDFADFQFFRLLPQAASLNGGFGKAYRLDGAELMIRSELTEEIAGQSQTIVQDLLGSYPYLACRIGQHLIPGKKQVWRLYGLDAGGFDLISGDKLLRYEFPQPLRHLQDIPSYIAKIVNPLP
jgi:heme iron utilization protein